MIHVELVKEIINKQAETYLFGKPTNRRKTILLRGEPGIGKSDSIRQVVANLQSKYDKQLNGQPIRLIDLRLPEYTATELKGAPQIKGENTVFYPVDRIPMDDFPTIIVLEEFDKAYKETKNAALGLVLDYAIDGKQLPPRTVIIATSNRMQDNADSKPLASTYRAGRLIIMDLAFDQGIFLTWARNHINPMITSFLEANADIIHTPDFDDNMLKSESYPCPRSWETLSAYLEDMHPNTTLVDINMVEICKGIIGQVAAERFVAYMKLIGEINIDQIMSAGKIGDGRMADDKLRQIGTAFAYKYNTKYNGKEVGAIDIQKVFNVLLDKNLGATNQKKILNTLLSHTKTRVNLIVASKGFEDIRSLLSEYKEIDEEMKKAEQNRTDE